MVKVEPHESLNKTSRAMEHQVYRDMYLRHGGDFEKMASELLEGDPKENARKVQLRFNNLGLSVRALREQLVGR
ncbi:MAG: hypothetical protein CMH57_02675 [Myxococcales bacterium]|nr:hypothetical protein [Myxococcales bacterium]